MDMKHRKYRNAQLSKKETEVVQFLETGSNNFWDAYYNYEGRKKRLDRPTLTTATWFNKVIASLHRHDIFKEIPFVLRFQNNMFIWQNPGINASKANFQALTLHDAYMEESLLKKKII
jgi:hypothetical protein